MQSVFGYQCASILAIAVQVLGVDVWKITAEYKKHQIKMK